MSEKDLIEKSWSSAVDKKSKKGTKPERLFVAILWKTGKKSQKTFCGVFETLQKAANRAKQHAVLCGGLRAEDDSNEKEVFVLCQDGTEYLAELRAVD